MTTTTTPTPTTRPGGRPGGQARRYTYLPDELVLEAFQRLDQAASRGAPGWHGTSELLTALQQIENERAPAGQTPILRKRTALGTRLPLLMRRGLLEGKAELGEFKRGPMAVHYFRLAAPDKTVAEILADYRASERALRDTMRDYITNRQPGVRSSAAHEADEPRAADRLTVHISTHLDPSVWRDLKVLARAQGISRAQLVMQVLTQYAEQHRVEQATTPATRRSVSAADVLRRFPIPRMQAVGS